MAKKLTMIIASALLFFSQNAMAQRPKSYQPDKPYCCKTYEMNDIENCNKWYAIPFTPHIPSLYDFAINGIKQTPQNKIEELVIKAAELEKSGEIDKALESIKEAIKKFEDCIERDGWIFERFYLDLLYLETNYYLKLNQIGEAEKTVKRAREILKDFIKANENAEEWKRDYIESEKKIWEELETKIKKDKKRK
jgi:tetratricopeptide (TPR) repeat protein